MVYLTFNIIKKISRTFFPFYKNSEIKFVFKKLEQDNINEQRLAMFVGGCVRKYLSNKEIDDIDIATVFTTEQIKEKFNNTKFKVVDSGVKHGTVTLISSKLKLELTTLRKDLKTDGRHADVEYINDWQIDSERRDFTINAIYLDNKGKIFDPQGGVNDLKNNFVKFIGNPQKRIQEDYLRIIRLIRFSLEYGSEIEEKIAQIVKLNLDGIKKISKERILNELFKILQIEHFIKINNKRNLKELFILIFPELKNLDRLKRLDKISKTSRLSKEILLSVILIDNKDNHEYFSHKYKISNDLKDQLNLIAKNFVTLQLDKKFFSTDLKKNIYFYGKEHLIALNILNFSVNGKIKLNDYKIILNKIKDFDIPKFIFDGNFLKANGMQEGSLIGKTLKLIESEWLKNDFKISEKRALEIIEKQKN